MRYFSAILRVFGVFFLIILFSSYFILNKIVNPYIGDQEDIYNTIVILSGNPERAVSASALFKLKKSSIILLSKERSIVKLLPSDTKIQTYDLYIKILQNHGISRDQIQLFGENNRSTFDEISMLSEYLRLHKERVLLVTDKFHVHRVKLIADYMNVLEKIDFHVVDTDSEKRLIQMYILEFFKTLNFFLFAVGFDFLDQMDYVKN